MCCGIFATAGVSFFKHIFFIPFIFISLRRIPLAIRGSDRLAPHPAADREMVGSPPVLKDAAGKESQDVINYPTERNRSSGG